MHFCLFLPKVTLNGYIEAVTNGFLRVGKELY